MTSPLHLFDMEARTPVGLTAASAAAAVRADVSLITEHPFMLDPTGEPVRGARDSKVDPRLFGPRRLFALAQAPLERMCERLPAGLPTDLRLLLALPEHRPGWEAHDERTLVATLTSALRARFRDARVVVAGKGHAGAFVALQTAVSWMARGDVELCLVGAVDSYFHPDTLDWLYEQGRVATTDTRSAFFPGEAAAFLALTSSTARRLARLPSLAQLRRVDVALEKRVLSSDEECLGEGLAQVLSSVGAALPPDARIERIICDINGERYRAQEWGLAVLRSRPMFRDATAYEAPSASWGDVGAASACLFAILAAQGWMRRYAPPSNALLFAGSDGGTRGAALLEIGSTVGAP